MSGPGLAKRARRTLRVWAIRAGLWLGAALPFRVAWGLGTVLGRLAWWVAHRDRELALAHLALALPEMPASRRRAVVRDMFLHFGHAAVEWARADEIGRDIERYVAFPEDGVEAVRAAIAEGRGIVCVTGHMGNWELLVRRMVRAGVPFTVIAARSWDRRLDELVEGFRLRGGVPTVYREDPAAGRKLLRSFRDGRALGILTDQDTNVQNVFIPFFGHLAATPRAAADLALRFGAPVLVGASRRRGPRPGDGYAIEWEWIPYDPAPADREAEVVRLTAACSAALERFIRMAPSEWVWMHRRWKTKRP